MSASSSSRLVGDPAAYYHAHHIVQRTSLPTHLHWLLAHRTSLFRTMPIENCKALLLAELARGIRLTLANAEKLFEEGQFLHKYSCLGRAYLCHRISLEELRKVEVIGVWITNLFLGEDIDTEQMTLALASHEAKNYANANFAGLLSKEPEPGKHDDRKRALDAFKALEERFRETTAAKNAALYVEYRNSVFSEPGEVIEHEAVVGISTLNGYLLDLADPTVRVAERMAKDDPLYRAVLRGERFAEPENAKAADRPIAFGALTEKKN